MSSLKKVLAKTYLKKSKSITNFFTPTPRPHTNFGNCGIENTQDTLINRHRETVLRHGVEDGIPRGAGSGHLGQ